GSVAGYLEIADTSGQAAYSYLDQLMVSRANAFKRAAVKLHATMLKIYDMDNHPALNPAYAPASFLASQGNGLATQSSRVTASFLNFFQNIVDTPKATLFVAGGAVVGAAPEVEEISDVSAFSTLNDVFNEIGAAP